MISSSHPFPVLYGKDGAMEPCNLRPTVPAARGLIACRGKHIYLHLLSEDTIVCYGLVQAFDVRPWCRPSCFSFPVLRLQVCRWLPDGTRIMLEY